ncbi:HET-domain-containing protein [Bimuria novae-zelandiae CBS 107.79]|uniref:HET-domain-containing protein n=1 Tax=Bimuria novae-zelandiae CBS 107.79 TaxID=1447943 RepID=A0A6A5VA06_9PLEO|nr:HET-domain-containing protein [Bimuria novae-zelandiae CBS 107.79]
MPGIPQSVFLAFEDAERSQRTPQPSSTLRPIPSWLCVGLGWFGWACWVKSSHKTPEAIFDLIAVFLLLLVLTFIFLKVFLVFETIADALSPVCVWIAPRTLSKCNHCRLCEKCDEIIDASVLLRGSLLMTKPVEKYGFYDLPNLRKSAAGCHLCQILLSSVIKDEVVETPISSTSYLLPKTSQKSSATQETSGTPQSARIVLEIMMLARVSSPSRLRMLLSGPSIVKAREVIITWESEPEKHIAKHNCYNSILQNSEDIFEWANEKVKKCHESFSHVRCDQAFVDDALKHYLPLRLLDLRRFNEGVVSLVSTKSFERTCRRIHYCSLSHCWGRKVNVTLTTENMAAMTTIQWQDLPPSFRDAIGITRKLGIDYLWIDSLCIVQDDPQDWEEQAANMGLIYANSRCVISATAASDASGGCFLPRALSYDDCVLRQDKERLLVVSSLERFPTLDTLFDRFVDQAPVSTRGWTFQERYLACPTLHFCNGFVLFECNSVIASHYKDKEKGYSFNPIIRADGKLHDPKDIRTIGKNIPEIDENIPRHKALPLPPNTQYFSSKYKRAYLEDWKRRPKTNPLYTAQQEKREKLLRSSARTGVRGAFDFVMRFQGDSLAEKMEFHECWFSLMGQYSTRHLTFAKDKAMAIAGVAFFIQQRTNLSYAAGLWAEILVFNLLWVRAGQPGPRILHASPTWSWTSIEGPITHRLSYVKNYEHYINFKSSWKDISPLIEDEALLETESVNGIIHNAKLRLNGHLCRLDPANINVDFDVAPSPEYQNLLFLPILSFENRDVEPEGDLIKLHGIALVQRATPPRCQTEDTTDDNDASSKSGLSPKGSKGKGRAADCYERVGYFWTVDKPTVEALLMATRQKSTIEIV